MVFSECSSNRTPPMLTRPFSGSTCTSGRTPLPFSRQLTVYLSVQNSSLCWNLCYYIGWNSTTALKDLFVSIYFMLLSTLNEQKIGIFFFFRRANSPLFKMFSSRTVLVPTAISPKSISFLSMISSWLMEVVVIYRKLISADTSEQSFCLKQTGSNHW